jgi:hypothetical protein
MIAVIGAISRKGNVTCQIIGDTSTETMSRFVRKAVSDRVSLVATDEGAGYHKLYQAFPHKTVDHKALEYVRGQIHTNNIESFWALLKRGIIGTYHNVSKKYLPLYLAEFQFRHNHRKCSCCRSSIRTAAARSDQGPRAYDLRTHTRSGLGLSCTISVALKIAPRRRKFAPYLGVAYDGKFGETADFTRAEGGIVNDLRFVFGIRLWY